MKSRTELFAEALARRRIKRWIKERIIAFTSGLSVEELRYAAENNLNIISTLLKPGEQKSRQRKIAPFQHLVRDITADDILRLFDEVSPEHAAVLREHRLWFTQQVEAGRHDLLGT